MRLLFDENLPPRLVSLLADISPASIHVRDVGLKNVADELVRQHAPPAVRLPAQSDLDTARQLLRAGD